MVWGTPGVVFQDVTGAPVPAETEVGRTSQIKEIAHRFSAHQFWLPDDTRYELRLLTQPVHRYQAPDLGILSSAVFIFCHSTNPEAALLIELAKDGSAAAKWRFALARIGHAEFHAHLDGKEVWTVPRADRVRPSSAYWAFTVTIGWRLHPGAPAYFGQFVLAVDTFSNAARSRGASSPIAPPLGHQISNSAVRA